MCLDYVKTKANYNSNVISSGYKEFCKSGKTLEFQNFPIAGEKSKVVPRDKWIKATGPSILTSMDAGRYPALFHIYEDSTDNDRKRRTRVYLRGIKTVGTQSGETVIIAEEMYVPSDPDDWPPLSAQSQTPKPPSAMQLVIEKMSAFVDELKKTAGNA